MRSCDCDIDVVLGHCWGSVDEALAKRVGEAAFMEEVDAILQDVSRGHSQVRLARILLP